MSLRRFGARTAAPALLLLAGPIGAGAPPADPDPEPAVTEEAGAVQEYEGELDTPIERYPVRLRLRDRDGTISGTLTFQQTDWGVEDGWLASDTLGFHLKKPGTDEARTTCVLLRDSTGFQGDCCDDGPGDRNCVTLLVRNGPLTDSAAGPEVAAEAGRATAPDDVASADSPDAGDEGDAD